MGLLIAGDADEADVRLGNQRVGLVHHPEPGPQHRNQQRRVGQPRPVVSASGVRTGTASVRASRVAS